MTSSVTVAKFMPFLYSSFNKGQINPTGVYIGHDLLGTKAPVMIASWIYEDPHIVVIGKTGSGKTTFVKTFVSRLHDLENIGTIILDLEGEYLDVVNSRGGKIFSFGKKKTIGENVAINVLDLYGFDPRVRGEQIIAMFELLFQLSDVALLMLREALMRTYHNKQITYDPSTWENPMPVMSDLFETIHTMLNEDRDLPEKNSLRALERRVVQFTKHGRYYYFDSQTSLELEELTEKLVCINLHELGDKAKDIVIHMILQLLIDSFGVLEEFRYLIVEEGWRLLEYGEAENKLFEIIRRGRKHNLGLIFVSQDVGDFRERARTLINNSATNFLFKVKPSELNLVQRAFGLDSYMLDRLSSCNIGECFITTPQIGNWIPAYIDREIIPRIPKSIEKEQDFEKLTHDVETDEIEHVQTIENESTIIGPRSSLFKEGIVDKALITDVDYHRLIDNKNIEKIMVWGVEKGRTTYLVNKDIIRNPRHEGTVKEVVKFLEGLGYSCTTKKTVGPDVFTEISGLGVAIEVEMGTVPEKRVKEKIRRLRRDCNKLFILVRAKDRRKYEKIVLDLEDVSLVIRQEFAEEINILRGENG
jgi:GTPase SAR1 family protein